MLFIINKLPPPISCFGSARYRETFVNAQTVRWFDCSEKFLNPDGTTKKELFDYEVLHPSTEGYRVWREALEPELEKLLGK